jgi:hypothetical protein
MSKDERIWQVVMSGIVSLCVIMTGTVIAVLIWATVSK